jgi:hypothetical protein
MTIKSGRVSNYWFLSGVIFFVICSYSQTSQNKNNSYKQIRIPLDELKGVPFSKGEEGYVIWGFDVDSNENFYFAGGKKATLACFSKYGKPIYRRTFLSFHPGPIHIVGKELYLFETWNGILNTLIEFDKTNGSIIREYPNTITKSLKSRGFKSVEDYQFSDSTLRITYTDSEGIDKPKTICFNLKGELLPDRNQYPANPPAVEKDNSHEYLGKLGNDYVFGKFDDEGKTYDLILKKSSNTIISEALVERKYLGEPLCGFSCLPPEHRKLRNNKLYMLNRDKNMAVITEIDLAAIFHN